MGLSTWSGPQRTGALGGNGDPAIGYLRVSKTFSSYPGYPQALPAGQNPNGAAYLINGTSTAGLTQTLTITLSPNCQIIGFDIDVLTAYDSATSATLSIGSAAAGTQYVSGINAKTTGRAAPTYSASQLLAMSNITTNTIVYATVTSVGQPTVGTVLVTANYIQW